MTLGEARRIAVAAAKARALVFSEHAHEQAQARRVSVDDILSAVSAPRSFTLGSEAGRFNAIGPDTKGRPLQVVLAITVGPDEVIVVTVYRQPRF